MIINFGRVVNLVNLLKYFGNPSPLIVMIHRATFWAMLPSTGNQMRHKAYTTDLNYPDRNVFSMGKCSSNNRSARFPSNIAQIVALCIITFTLLACWGCVWPGLQIADACIGPQWLCNWTEI